ncbi:MAG: winged helix-turn-helix domain-containing protein [Nitrosopumilaceae archaeon]
MSNQIQQFHVAGSFNITVMIRILKSLSNNGPLKITTLAMHSRLNYSRCKKYLNLMNALNWIIFEKDGRSLKIRCTISGKRIMGQLANFMQKD